MKTIPNNLTNSSTILPYQRPIFERLCTVARASLFVDRSQFKVLKPRCNFWLIGPSGSGKTHLSKAVAEAVGVPIFSISVSDWILLGCGANRGGANTWPLIVDFVIKNISKQGAIIFLDELDKCSAESEWSSFLRTEIFSLCDSRVPFNIKDSESNDYSVDTIRRAEDFLQNKTMIIGGSAFQKIWDNNSVPSIGFTTSKDSAASNIKLTDLAAALPRELVNRFSSNMFILPQIKKQDYYDMIHSMSGHVPDIWRDRFISIGLSNLDKAVNDKKGARYVEETLLSALVEERAYLIESIPQKEEKHTSGLEFKNDLDDIHLF